MSRKIKCDKKPDHSDNAEPGTNLQSLHELFEVIGDRLTGKDVRMLKFVCSGLMPPEQAARVSDGRDFMMALERIGRIDESYFRHFHHLLKVIGRYDLLHMLSLRKRKPGNRFCNVCYMLNVSGHETSGIVKKLHQPIPERL